MVQRIIGQSSVVQELRETILRFAPRDAKVLILGENGTGKELVAHAIHDHSRRSKRPYLTINCGAIPETLIESELFGHVKGAFTGAVAERKGAFETADGGTVFLDEIGELPLSTQASLLRVLQSGTMQKIGESKTIKVNVRVIAATNRDLHQEMELGRFRKDLYHRLCQFPIRTPALRHRLSDVPLLARSFLSKIDPRLSFSPEAERALIQHDYPGNVRELQNIIERIAALADRQVLTASDVEYAMHLDEDPTVEFERPKIVEQGEQLERLIESVNTLVRSVSGVTSPAAPQASDKDEVVITEETGCPVLQTNDDHVAWLPMARF